MDYEAAYDISTIQLEPRLQEYVRRKKFNEENDIEPPIPEEQEFCITKYDLKVIKRYKQGEKNIYTSKRLAKDPHFIKPDTNDFEMQADFKKDPRYKRLQNKMQSHKDAQSKIRNYEEMDECYTLFHQSNPYDLRQDQKPRKIEKPYDDPENDNLSYDEDDFDFMMDSRDLVLGQSRPVKSKKNASRYANVNGNIDQFDDDYIVDQSNKNRGKYCYSPNKKYKNRDVYNHPPKIAYKQIVTPYQPNGGLKHSRDINDIIGNLDNYNKRLNKTYDYHETNEDFGEFDMPTYAKCKSKGGKREMQTGYQNVPFMYGNGLPNVTLEDSLRGGIRDSSKKSIGFRNPFEHQFDYISEDISDPDHSVQMWPENTRGQNKQTARPHSRAALSEQRLSRLEGNPRNR
jgi:hypothetical protein